MSPVEGLGTPTAEPPSLGPTRRWAKREPRVLRLRLFQEIVNVGDVGICDHCPVVGIVSGRREGRSRP